VIGYNVSDEYNAIQFFPNPDQNVEFGGSLIDYEYFLI